MTPPKRINYTSKKCLLPFFPEPITVNKKVIIIASLMILRAQEFQEQFKGTKQFNGLTG